MWPQRWVGLPPSIFVGDMSPTNILLYFSVPRNINNGIHRCYVPRLFYRLTEEFNVNSSVLYTDEYIVDSSSEKLFFLYE
jgi:hypothetical protein